MTKINTINLYGLISKIDKSYLYETGCPLVGNGTLPPALSQLEKVIKIINELYKEADFQFFYLLLEVLFLL